MSEAEKLMEKFKEMLEGKLSMADFEAFKEELKGSTISRDDIMEIVKAAIEDHAKTVLPAQPDVSWKDVEGQPGTFKRSIVLPTDAQFKAMVRNGVVTKATLDQAGAVEGAPVASMDTTVALASGNPYRQDVTVVPMSAGTVELPVLAALTMTRTAPNASVPDKAAQGGGANALGSRSIIADLVEALVQVGKPTIEDLPTIRNAIEFELTQRYSTDQGMDITAKIKASANAAGGITGVKTGVANALPTAENVIGKTSAVLAAVSTPYRMMAVWHISRAFEAVLNEAVADSQAAQYAFNVAMGVQTLHGYPVRVNDNLEDGGTNGEISAVFGSFRQGIALGERGMFDVEQNDVTKPGHTTFYGCGRTAAVVWHPQALAALSSGA